MTNEQLKRAPRWQVSAPPAEVFPQPRMFLMVVPEDYFQEALEEIERLKRYSLIVESYLDRETLKEVLTKYRATPDGRTPEPGGSPDGQP